MRFSFVPTLKERMSLKIVTIIPFIPQYLPIWTPESDCILAQDGGENKDLGLDNLEKRIFHTSYSSNRVGFSRIMNRAMATAFEAGYDVALIWNSDAALVGEPTQLLHHFEKNKDVAAVAPAKLPEGTDRSATGRKLNKKDTVNAYCLLTSGGPIFTNYKRGLTIETCGLDYCPLFAVRIEAFLACGGYATEYSPGFFEDADIWIKFRRFGWKCLVDTSVSYHHGDATGGSKSFGKLHSEDARKEQGGRALAILLAKWGVTGPLQAPLHLSPIDPIRAIREGESSSNDHHRQEDSPSQTESRRGPKVKKK